MLALLVVGVCIVVSTYQRQQQAIAQEPARPRAGDPLPKPDDGPEFQGILDKTPITFRDTAAYKALLERVRETAPAKLQAQARRDIGFSQLIQTPSLYRGVPIHLEGTARKIIKQAAEPNSKLFSVLFPKGYYFEAYVTTPSSGKNPITLVFEDAPENLPLGEDLHEPLVFDGYFLKLVAYMATDTGRFMPMLVGRIRWADLSTPGHAGAASKISPWWFVALGALLVLTVVRWVFAGKSAFEGLSHRAPSSPTAVNDQIDPDQLSAWVEDQAEDSDEYPTTNVDEPL